MSNNCKCEKCLNGTCSKHKLSKYENKGAANLEIACIKSKIPTLINEHSCSRNRRDIPVYLGEIPKNEPKKNSTPKIKFDDNICCTPMKTPAYVSYECPNEVSKSGILKKSKFDEVSEKKIDEKESTCSKMKKSPSSSDCCANKNNNINTKLSATCCSKMKNLSSKSDCCLNKHDTKINTELNESCCGLMKNSLNGSICCYHTEEISKPKNVDTIETKPDYSTTKPYSYYSKEIKEIKSPIKSFKTSCCAVNDCYELETHKTQEQIDKPSKKVDYRTDTYHNPNNEKQDLERLKTIDIDIEKMIERIKEKRRCGCTTNDLNIATSKSETKSSKRTVPINLTFKRSGPEVKVSKSMCSCPTCFKSTDSLNNISPSKQIILPEVKVDIGPERIQTIQIDVKPSALYTDTSGIITIPVQLRFRKPCPAKEGKPCPSINAVTSVRSVKSGPKYSEKLVFEACDTKEYFNETYMEELREEVREKTLKIYKQMSEETSESRSVTLTTKEAASKSIKSVDFQCPECVAEVTECTAESAKSADTVQTEPKSDITIESEDKLRSEILEQKWYEIINTDDYIEPYLLEECTSTENAAVQTDLILGQKLFSDSLNSVKSKGSNSVPSVNAFCKCGKIDTSVRQYINWNKVFLPPTDQIILPEISDLAERQPKKLFPYYSTEPLNLNTTDKRSSSTSELPEKNMGISEDNTNEKLENDSEQPVLEPSGNEEPADEEIVLEEKLEKIAAEEKPKKRSFRLSGPKRRSTGSSDNDKKRNVGSSDNDTKKRSVGSSDDDTKQRRSVGSSEDNTEKKRDSTESPKKGSSGSLDAEVSSEVETKEINASLSEAEPSKQTIVPPQSAMKQEPIPGDSNFVYAFICGKDEPYVKSLWKEFPSETCDENSTLPWKKIVLPEKITIRKIQKLKPVKQEGNSLSTSCICRTDTKSCTCLNAFGNDSASKFEAVKPSLPCPFIRSASVSCVCSKQEKSGRVTFDRDQIFLGSTPVSSKTVTCKYLNKNLKESESSKREFQIAACSCVKKVKKNEDVKKIIDIKIDPVVAAFQACEAELKPVREALFQVQRKLKKLNMPELDCIFKKENDYMEIPIIQKTCKCKKDSSKSRGTGTKHSKTKLKAKKHSSRSKKRKHCDDTESLVSTGDVIEKPFVKKNVQRLRAANKTTSKKKIVLKISEPTSQEYISGNERSQKRENNSAWRTMPLIPGFNFIPMNNSQNMTTTSTGENSTWKQMPMIPGFNIIPIDNSQNITTTPITPRREIDRAQDKGENSTWRRMPMIQGFYFGPVRNIHDMSALTQENNRGAEITNENVFYDRTGANSHWKTLPFLNSEEFAGFRNDANPLISSTPAAQQRTPTNSQQEITADDICSPELLYQMQRFFEQDLTCLHSGQGVSSSGPLPMDSRTVHQQKVSQPILLPKKISKRQSPQKINRRECEACSHFTIYNSSSSILPQSSDCLNSETNISYFGNPPVSSTPLLRHKSTPISKGNRSFDRTPKAVPVPQSYSRHEYRNHGANRSNFCTCFQQMSGRGGNLPSSTNQESHFSSPERSEQKDYNRRNCNKCSLTSCKITKSCPRPTSAIPVLQKSANVLRCPDNCATRSKLFKNRTGNDQDISQEMSSQRGENKSSGCKCLIPIPVAKASTEEKIHNQNTNINSNTASSLPTGSLTTKSHQSTCTNCEKGTQVFKTPLAEAYEVPKFVEPTESAFADVDTSSSPTPVSKQKREKRIPSATLFKLQKKCSKITCCYGCKCNIDSTCANLIRSKTPSKSPKSKPPSRQKGSAVRTQFTTRNQNSSGCIVAKPTTPSSQKTVVRQGTTCGTSCSGVPRKSSKYFIPDRGMVHPQFAPANINQNQPDNIFQEQNIGLDTTPSQTRNCNPNCSLPPYQNSALGSCQPNVSNLSAVGYIPQSLNTSKDQCQRQTNIQEKCCHQKRNVAGFSPIKGELLETGSSQSFDFAEFKRQTDLQTKQSPNPHLTQESSQFPQQRNIPEFYTYSSHSESLCQSASSFEPHQPTAQSPVLNNLQKNPNLYDSRQPSNFFEVCSSDFSSIPASQFQSIPIMERISNKITRELYCAANYGSFVGNCSPPMKRNKGIQKTGSLYKLRRKKRSQKKCVQPPSDNSSSVSTLSYKKSGEYIEPIYAATQPEISQRKYDYN